MLDKLVDDVMKIILRGDEPHIKALRGQYESAKIESIELSGAGFFANFKIDDSVVVDCDNMQIGDVSGAVNGMDDAVGFVLFIRDGKIDFLEGYTVGVDEWPDEKEITIKENRHV